MIEKLRKAGLQPNERTEKAALRRFENQGNDVGHHRHSESAAR